MGHSELALFSNSIDAKFEKTSRSACLDLIFNYFNFPFKTFFCHLLSISFLKNYSKKYSFKISMIAPGSFLAFSIYELISFPLYIRIIFILTRNSDFQNHFYRLICFNGILDVSHCLITIIFYRLPMFGPIIEILPTVPSRLISFVVVCYFSLIYQIFFLHVAISLNRLTGIFSPFKHQIFWERWWPLVPALGFAISIGLTFHRIFSVAQFTQIGVDCGFTPVIVQYDLYSVNQNLLTAIFGSFSLLSCLILNGITLAKIVQRKRANKNLQQQSFKNEIHLFIVSFWMMLFMCIFIAFEMALWGNQTWLKAIFPDDDPKVRSCFLFSQIPWVEDCFSLSQPWVLILANKSLRSAALPFAHKEEQKKRRTQQGKSHQNQIGPSGIITVTPMAHFGGNAKIHCISSKSM